MSFKIPFFNVPARKEDNNNLFLFLRELFGKWSSSDLILDRELSIGDWDMDATASVTVDYKNTNDVFSFKRIIAVSVLIINDDEDITYDVSLIDGGFTSIAINATNITLTRKGSGFFDSADFDSTSITTRGFVTIRYTT